MATAYQLLCESVRDQRNKVRGQFYWLKKFRLGRLRVVVAISPSDPSCRKWFESSLDGKFPSERWIRNLVWKNGHL